MNLRTGSEDMLEIPTHVNIYFNRLHSIAGHRETRQSRAIVPDESGRSWYVIVWLRSSSLVYYEV